MDSFDRSCLCCQHHDTYYDDMDDGTIISDGCTCDHDEGDDIYHFDNCMEYTDKFKGCPFFIEAEEFVLE